MGCLIYVWPEETQNERIREYGKKSALANRIFLAYSHNFTLLMVFISALQFEGHSLKMSLLWSGAVMAIAALVAQNRHSHFTTLVTPNTFASADFVAVLLKYRKYQPAGGWVFLLLEALGVLVGVYGSLVS